MKQLFLAQFKTRTTHSPGDDDMRDGGSESWVIMVEAFSAEDAEEIIRLQYEQNRPYIIRVNVDNLLVSPVLTRQFAEASAAEREKKP